MSAPGVEINESEFAWTEEESSHVKHRKCLGSGGSGIVREVPIHSTNQLIVDD
jgi:hypothetical protein